MNTKTTRDTKRQTLVLGLTAILLSALALGSITPTASAFECGPQQTSVPYVDWAPDEITIPDPSDPGAVTAMVNRAVAETQECVATLNPSLSTDLVSINAVSDVTEHGKPFTVAWHVHYISPYNLPITVTVKDVSVVGPCYYGSTTVAGASPVSESEKNSYRLYPPSINEMLTGIAELGPSSIVIQVNGHAGTASGGDAYNDLNCAVPLVAFATDGLRSGFPIAPDALVRAVPLSIIDVPMGHIHIIDGDGSASMVVTTPNVNGDLAMAGLADSLSVSVSVTTLFTEGNDEWHDTDYGKVVFDDGDNNYVNKVEKSVYPHDFVVPDGSTESVCVWGELYDDEVLDFDDHEKLKTGDTICLSITYTQVEEPPTEIFGDGCDGGIGTLLAGNVPSAQEIGECPGGLFQESSVPTGNYGYEPVWFQTESGPSLFVQPPREG